jgi:hypothetical protein
LHLIKHQHENRNHEFLGVIADLIADNQAHVTIAIESMEHDVVGSRVGRGEVAFFGVSANPGAAIPNV